MGIPDSVTDIGDRAFGFISFWYAKLEGFTICSVRDSAAEAYAILHGFEFIEHDRDTCALHVCVICNRNCTLHICPICERACTLHVCTICERDCTLHICEICERTCTDPNCPICNDNPNPGRVPCDKGCCADDNPYVAVPGHVLAEENVSIFDALEILKALVNMDGAIQQCPNAKTAALITADAKTNNTPTIFDALEILKKLVKMPNLIDTPIKK